ncbi:hypothetical protein AMTRI_Chr01g127210 [Amborella trichopoda]|nr:protein DGS1, mitochondrial isoform X2 [Amborella trichopoda]|eukprot:XP_006836232.2 protein DGS1, mitochondrial isoform X2 [Amborella trichopoda]
MEDHSEDKMKDPNPKEGIVVSFYSSRFWERLQSYLPSANSRFIVNLSKLYVRNPSSKFKREKLGLPLPLLSSSFESSKVLTETTCRVIELLDDILVQILSSLHDIQKNLQFWQSRAEGSDARKVYFMVFERGPLAFIRGTVQLLRGYASEGSSMQHLVLSAAERISERIAVLTCLQNHLAMFLAQVYIEVDRFGIALTKDSNVKSLRSFLITINALFKRLEQSYDLPQSDYPSSHVDSNRSAIILQFEELPEDLQEKSDWQDVEIKDTVNVVSSNLKRLDSYLSLLVTKYRRPRKATLHWFRYTCGAVGLSICSVWILRHSSLMGSSDIDNWIREAKESTIGFWKDHVESPILSIRDELFETFRKRHKGMMELEEVQLTATSLHRMLLAFTEQIKGYKLPENSSDQEMLEIVMARYEKELMHPIQNLMGGELARLFLIQIQKLKLDIETVMLELNQILRANEINLAVLAALPAFFMSVGLGMLVRAWIKQDKGAEGRGKVARIQRRLLLVDAEKQIMHFQICMDRGQEEGALQSFGLMLLTLNLLYKVVERHARETGEWSSLRQDIIDLAKPGLQTGYKLTITSRMGRMYDSLLPYSRPK